MKIFIKFVNKVKSDGLNVALQKSFTNLMRKSKPTSLIKKERRRLSKELMKLHNNTVAYGPFRGMKLSEDVWWGKGDRAAMILGLYEQEVQKEISDSPKEYDIFIDLGAADGFFGVGSIVSKKFRKCYCYEASKIGQKAIKLNAIRNSVEDKITIYGIADEDFTDPIPSTELERAILLCDIEGGEFTLFSKKVFEVLRKSIVIIEVHENVRNAEIEVNNLIDSASEYFNHKFITTGSRDMSKFEELRSFSDSQRWLICSEGRSCLMRWLVLTPKSTFNE